MPGSKSVSKAEEIALTGENESQDSQEIFEKYQRQCGIGVMSSSPAVAMTTRNPQPPKPQPGIKTKGKKVQNHPANNNLEPPNAQGSRDTQTSTANHQIERAESNAILHVGTGQRPDEPTGRAAVGGDAAPSGVIDHPVSKSQLSVEVVDVPALPKAALAPKNMDFSQSPTQSNDGRSYEQYIHDSNPRPGKGLAEQPATQVVPTQSLSTEQRTLHEDDTGAVRFDFEELAARTSSPLYVDETEAADFSVPTSSRHHATLDPETPAPPRNPFLTSKDQAQLLRPSQLFGGTQFSSAIRKASPTSSRPSPDDFHPKNSISSNLMISSPLKARGLVSSPPVLGNSSSQGLPTTSPGHEDSEDSSSDRESQESPPGSAENHGTHAVKTRTAAEPMSEYEPMRRSQERRSTVERATNASSSDDHSDGDSISRRNRAQRRRKAASQKLAAIRFSRPGRSDDVEVPSTNKKKAAIVEARGDATRPNHDEPAEPNSLESVADSQEQRIEQARDFEAEQRPPLRSSIRRLSTGDGLMYSTAPLPRDFGVVSETPTATAKHHPSSRDAIPETSPVEGHKRLEALSAGPLPHVSQEELDSGITNPRNIRVLANSVPTLPRLKGQLQETGDGDASSSHPRTSSRLGIRAAGTAPEDEEQAVARESKRRKVAAPAVVLSSPPALSTRSKKRRSAQLSEQQTPGMPSSTAPAGPPTSTSVLTALSRTPAISSSTTPATQISPSEGLNIARGRGLGSASRGAGTRSRRLETDLSLPEPKAASTDETKIGRARRQPRSFSTDELAQSSPSVPTFDQSLRMAKPSGLRRGRNLTRHQSASREQSLRGHGIFDGMAFAISFEPKRAGETQDAYDDRMQYSKDVAEKIVQAGGTILVNGFDELFDTLPPKSATTSPVAPSQPPSDIALSPRADGMGFTALIADGHSRKVKYMQALALGLPCIAPRWIATCLDKRDLIDWTPYLLCAGTSSFLGGAIRSRNIASYDAGSARLAEMIQERSRLLAGRRILVVMRRATEAKKMAYVFLAQVLGASLARVETVEEARAELRRKEGLGQAYDWVYLDDTAVKVEQLFGAGAAPHGGGGGGGGGKKRKRGSAAAATASAVDEGKPAPKKVRVLSDELVIQSLILGSLIEEGEMED